MKRDIPHFPERESLHALEVATRKLRDQNVRQERTDERLGKFIDETKTRARMRGRT